jgi:hypothetical protein
MAIDIVEACNLQSAADRMYPFIYARGNDVTIATAESNKKD